MVGIGEGNHWPNNLVQTLKKGNKKMLDMLERLAATHELKITHTKSSLKRKTGFPWRMYCEDGTLDNYYRNLVEIMNDLIALEPKGN